MGAAAVAVHVNTSSAVLKAMLTPGGISDLLRSTESVTAFVGGSVWLQRAWRSAGADLLAPRYSISHFDNHSHPRISLFLLTVTGVRGSTDSGTVATKSSYLSRKIGGHSIAPKIISANAASASL